ncbi:MAG: nicotinate phosphoribosyltransferase [Phaeodactylibacter sp.]|uniref:nicotinate phosphoribosyltransferase n=1 Tax=Phaeodactylibacter sp. TaxID=1940289 RepID=UPI0032ED472B
MPNTHLSQLYRGPFGLLTDLYQLTMAYGYWRSGLYNRQANFHLFYRKPPFQNGFAISAGLELAIDFLSQFRFSAADIQYLGGLKGSTGAPLFNEAFLNYLQRMQLELTVHAMPEGTAAFPNQPILRVEGPLLQCQLVETGLLTLVNFSTLLATKAARIVDAAEGDSVLEFGMRRSQGLDGAMTAARATYIGGVHATSNVMAGRLYGIPVRGTHAHSWVMAYEDELLAFQNYAEALPGNCIFLVDTYDTEAGVKHAVSVGKWLREQGYDMNGIRLDSGDLTVLSKTARQILDAAGFTQTAIVASNDLDEYRIAQLKKEGAKITVWGVGTRLATGHGDPALGGVYKLSAIQNEHGEWEDRIKRSEEAVKASNPGLLQVWRSEAKQEHPGDALYDIRYGMEGAQIWDESSGSWGQVATEKGHNLLVPVLDRGQLVYDFPKLSEVRSYAMAQWQQFVAQPSYPYGLSPALHEVKSTMMATHS